MRAVATTVAAKIPEGLEGTEPADLTLLELVGAVCDVTDNDDEVVATVIQMLRSGRVRLCGNFRNTRHSDFS
jgi:hypothetical protein